MVFCGFCESISTHPKHTKHHHKSQASCLLLLPRHCKGCQCESDSLLPVFPVSRSVSGQRGDTDSRYQGPHPPQLTQRHMVSLCFWLWLWLPFSGQEKRGKNWKRMYQCKVFCCIGRQYRCHIQKYCPFLISATLGSGKPLPSCKAKLIWDYRMFCI